MKLTHRAVYFQIKKKVCENIIYILHIGWEKRMKWSFSVTIASLLSLPQRLGYCHVHCTIIDIATGHGYEIHKLSNKTISYYRLLVSNSLSHNCSRKIIFENTVHKISLKS